MRSRARGTVSVTALLAALLGLSLAGCGAGASRAVQVAVDAAASGRYAARPPTVTFSADGDLVASGLRWSGWSQTAIGTGTFAFRRPGGGVSRVPGTVTLNRIVGCRGRRYYTRAAVHAARAPFAVAPVRFVTPCG